jgi:hypothetical protein
MYLIVSFLFFTKCEDVELSVRSLDSLAPANGATQRSRAGDSTLFNRGLPGGGLHVAMHYDPERRDQRTVLFQEDPAHLILTGRSDFCMVIAEPLLVLVLW